MLILGLDTATAQAGVAIGGVDGVRASFHLVNEGRHAESLTPAIEFVSRLAKIELSQITAVAVDIGPGLFTGLRVGIATAKAIAFARGIPLIPVSSLEVLKHAARLSNRKVVPIIDALSDEVYYQIDEPALGRPEDVARQLKDDVLLVGDGARRYAEIFAGHEIADIRYPSAATLVEIAASREGVNEADVQILYLRKPYVHEKE